MMLDVLHIAGVKVIENHDIMPIENELVHNVASYESSSAGHQDLHLITSTIND
jgi:hypothetical protein